MEGIGQAVFGHVPASEPTRDDLKLEVHVDKQIKDIVDNGLGGGPGNDLGIQVCLLSLDSHHQGTSMRRLSGKGSRQEEGEE